MYDYRRMTPKQQQALMAERNRRGYPWHSPPHVPAPEGFRIITGACYEHRELLAAPDRLAWFEQQLLEAINKLGSICAAWCVLPNHYHILVKVDSVRGLSKGLGQLHGRTSFEMNRADDARGRKVWYRCQDRAMRSERHYFVTMNYIHNNPVKHGYVPKWQKWPYSSVHWYLEHRGRDWLLDAWRESPVLNYGDTWDLF
jgi:putative transposase